MCGCGQCTGNVLYITEKLASFCALTLVVICVMATIAVTLGLGIGLGYNYCFVDLKVMTEANRQNPSLLRSRERSDDDEPDFTEKPNYRRTQPTTLAVARRTMAIPAIKHTMAIPLNSDIDFPTLLSKLRGRNRNVTLELIT